MDTCLTAKYCSLVFLSLNGCFDKLWLLRSWSSVGRQKVEYVICAI
jgi:hypothetical protein